jgi:hypothetical protein
MLASRLSRLLLRFMLLDAFRRCRCRAVAAAVAAAAGSPSLHFSSLSCFAPPIWRAREALAALEFLTALLDRKHRGSKLQNLLSPFFACAVFSHPRMRSKGFTCNACVVAVSRRAAECRCRPWRTAVYAMACTALRNDAPRRAACPGPSRAAWPKHFGLRSAAVRSRPVRSCAAQFPARELRSRVASIAAAVRIAAWRPRPRAPKPSVAADFGALQPVRWQARFCATRRLFGPRAPSARSDAARPSRSKAACAEAACDPSFSGVVAQALLLGCTTSRRSPRASEPRGVRPARSKAARRPKPWFVAPRASRVRVL